MIKSKCSGKKKLSVKMGPSEYKIDGENYFIVDLELDKNEMTMSVWGAKKKGTLWRGNCDNV